MNFMIMPRMFVCSNLQLGKLLLVKQFYIQLMLGRDVLLSIDLTFQAGDRETPDTYAAHHEEATGLVIE